MEPPDAHRPFIPLAADATGCDAGAKACLVSMNEWKVFLFFWTAEKSKINENNTVRNYYQGVYCILIVQAKSTGTN